MTEQKKPQAGEYWRGSYNPDMRCQIVGVANNGKILLQFADNQSECEEMSSFLRAWHHLPDCTGWGWEPSMVSVPGKVVGKVRVTPIGTCQDCGEFRGHGHEDVCPMAWIESTDTSHMLGKDIDSFQYSDGTWETVKGIEGMTLRQNRLEKWRCRRKDLPPVPAAVDISQQERPEGPLTRMVRETAECMACTRCGDICEKTTAQQFIEPDNRTPNDPLSWPHSSQKTRTTVRLFVPRRVLDEPSIDYPVRSCFTQNGIKDVATWVEVKHDGYRFYVEGD